MKDTINERILMLKTESGLGNLDFCHKAKISHGTLNNIQKGENVSEKTIHSISEGLGISKEWIRTGKGEKKLSVPVSAEKSGFQKALDLLEEQLKKKDDQIAGLMALLQKVNFHEALENAAAPWFNLSNQGTVSGVATVN
jgi:transcriptional regulator with XRE-family HTH domain